jgi:hypothetical protein
MVTTPIIESFRFSVSAWSDNREPRLLARPSAMTGIGTTLDILHVKRLAADHSANVGSRGRRRRWKSHTWILI